MKFDPKARHSRVLAVIAEGGGVGVPVTDITVSTGLPRKSVQRVLASLVEQGVIERAARGVYRTADGRRQRKVSLATDSGNRIWRALFDNDLPAYVSGLDVVGGYTHQFVMGFPHLVVVDPGRAADVDFALSRGRFAVRPMRDVPLLADADRTVLLTEARTRHHPTSQVRSHLAPAELAWLDLYRAARAGNYPITGGELGRMLAVLVRDARFERRLRTLDRRYLAGEVASVLDGAAASGFASTVADGFLE
jgi:DNA-binding MarR family transcriptional regulator